MEGYLSEGVTPTLDGGLESTPNNRIRDAAMQELTGDGTKTMRLLKGSILDGHHFYSTPVAGKQSALVKQTGLPQKPDERVRLESEPVIETGPRPLGPYDPHLPRLTVKKIPLAASKQGFAGGVRLAAIGVEDASGNLTTTTEPAEFTLANGQDIEWYPLQDMPTGGVNSVLFVSEAVPVGQAPKASTMREQSRARKGTAKKRVSGPYDRKGRKRPSVNETYIGRVQAPGWGGRRADLRYGGAPRDMSAVLDLRFFFVFSTPRGDSLATPKSQSRSFGAEKDHAVFVRPRKPPKNATGFKPYALVNGVSYRVVRPKRIYESRPFALNEWVPVYANLAADGETDGEAVGPTVLVQEDPTEEDTSGVEAPAGEMDAPVGIGATRPAAGAYWKTYGPQYGGVERRAAVPVRVTITNTELARLEIPNPVNRLANPAGTERGADGLALAWTENLANGVLADVPGQKLGVATSGLVNDTAATPYRESDPVPVNSGVVETMRGILEVSNYAGTVGDGRAMLIQKTDGVTIAGGLLSSRASNGSQPFDVTFGPLGSGAAIILNEGATEVAMRIDTGTAAGRNMTVRGYDMAIHPFDGAPRKFVFPPEGSAEIADPNAPPEAPYSPGPVVVITRPGSAAPPPGFVPVQVLDAPTNPTTQGFAANSTVGVNVGLEAALPFRAYSNATEKRAQAFWSKTYPIGSGAGFVNNSSLAVRGPFRFPLLPTRVGNSMIFLSIHDATGNYMGFVKIHNNSAVYLTGRNRLNQDTLKATANVTASDLLDAEIIVGGGGTTRGRVSLIAGVNEGMRRELASVDGLDFGGRTPRQIRFMGVYEQDTAGKWEVLCDWLRVTSSGDVVADYGDIPNLPPDRPIGANGSYRELDEDGLPINQLYIQVPPGFEGPEYGAVYEDFFVLPESPQTLTVYGRHEDLTPQQHSNLRLRLFDAAGNEWQAPTAMPADLSGTSAGWTEYVSYFTPPPGFYRARLEIKRTEAGMLIFQEPGVFNGAI